MRLDDADYETGDAERRPLVHPLTAGRRLLQHRKDRIS